MHEAAAMPWRKDVEYLREKAARFRRLAAGFAPSIADKLLNAALEIEQKADEIERREATRSGGGS